MNSPTPSEIRAARNAASLTQTQAAALVHRSLNSWQRWEIGDRTMPSGLWELFKNKCDLPSSSPVNATAPARKALLTARITVDHVDRHTPVYDYLRLFRVDGALVWRHGGYFGDDCETLPRPESVGQAKLDFKAFYGRPSFSPAARWL